MATQTQTNDFKKGYASFVLRGKLRFTPNTFTLDKKSDSGFISNRMYLGVECGQGNVVYAQMFDGYFDPSTGRTKQLYLHTNKVDPDNPNRVIDDYTDSMIVDWDQRFEKAYIENAGPACFIRVGLRYNSKKELVVNNYLTAYDAVADIAEFIDEADKDVKDNLIAEVRGDIEYQYYDGRVSYRKNIKSIRLKPDLTEKDFGATFTQTIYADKESLGKPDMEKKIFPLNVKVPDYVNKYNGVEIKSTVPFDVEMQLDATAKMAKFFADTLKNSNGYGRFVVRGHFVESGSAEDFDISTLPKEAQAWVEQGLVELEDLKMTVASGNQRTQVMSIDAFKVTKDESGGLAMMVEKNVYSQKEMDSFGEEFYRAVAADKSDDSNVQNETVTTEEDDDLPFDTDEKNDDENGMNWMLSFLDESK